MLSRVTLPLSRSLCKPLASVYTPACAFSTVKDVIAREIIDSRGNPTVEVDVHTEDGRFRASVPSGASTGVYEAVELRDGGDRYAGKGVQQAVANVAKLKDAIVGKDVADQAAIDEIMIKVDGTPNKGNIGANAILGVSLAVSKAGAAALNIPLYRHYANLAGNKELVLPVPSLNVINGGSHAGNRLAFQEFMILPIGADSFSHGLQMGCEVYHQLKSVIKSKYGQDATNVGDEGGFAPNIQESAEGVELLATAIEKAGYTGKISLGLDAAASEFLVDGGKYDLDFKYKESPSSVIDPSALADVYADLSAKFPIVSIEDPFDQDDWEGWIGLTSRIGESVQIVGDDLLVTNPERIKDGISRKACNALLLKVNQIGSVTESIQACNDSQDAGWGVMVSHRSGETEDTYIADLAVGLNAGQIKTGAPCRSERTAKYNQLRRIEEEIIASGETPIYAGADFRFAKRS